MPAEPNSPDKQLGLIIADDHAVLREGLGSMLAEEVDFRVLATVSSAYKLLEALDHYKPDVLVCDLDMLTSRELLELKSLQAAGRLQIIVLSVYATAKVYQQAYELGFSSLLPKSSPARKLVNVIRLVASGERVYPAVIHNQHGTKISVLDSLTERELEVLTLIAAGSGNAAIASKLGLSENTVKFHLRNVYSKLDVRNRTQAASTYRQYVVGNMLG